MSKDPAFLFYPEPYLTGTYGMTFDQKGRYVDLLCLQHQRGHLDKELFSQILDGNIDGAVAKKFVVDDDGRYYNERLETEIIKRKEYTENRLRNLSASSHMGNHMKDHVVDYMETHTESHTINIDIDTDSQYKSTLDESRFTEFWGIYPKKIGKKAAYTAWKRIKVTAELHDKMLAAIHVQKTGAQWHKDNGQYIPNPATWLNQGRWDDEVSASTGQGKGYHNPFPELARKYEEAGE
jgi:hypothetical protein